MTHLRLRPSRWIPLGGCLLGVAVYAGYRLHQSHQRKEHASRVLAEIVKRLDTGDPRDALEWADQQCPSLEPLARTRCGLLLSRSQASWRPLGDWIDSAKMFHENQDSILRWQAEEMLGQIVPWMERPSTDTSGLSLMRSRARTCLDRSTSQPECRQLDVFVSLHAHQWDSALRKSDQWLGLDSQDVWIRGAKGISLLALQKPASALHWLPRIEYAHREHMFSGTLVRLTKLFRYGRIAAMVSLGSLPTVASNHQDSLPCGRMAQRQGRLDDLEGAASLWEYLGQPDSAEVCRRAQQLVKFQFPRPSTDRPTQDCPNEGMATLHLDPFPPSQDSDCPSIPGTFHRLHWCRL